MKSILKKITLCAAVAAALSLVHTVKAIGFSVDEPDHFIWDSGLISPSAEVEEFGINW